MFSESFIKKYISEIEYAKNEMALVYMSTCYDYAHKSTYIKSAQSHYRCTLRVFSIFNYDQFSAKAIKAQCARKFLRAQR